MERITKNPRFKEIVKEARKELKLTVRQVAEKAGCFPSQVAEYETGKRLPPKKDSLKKLCLALKLNFKDTQKIAEIDRQNKPNSDPSVKKLFRDKPDLAFALCREAEKADEEFLAEIITKLRKKNGNEH